MRYFDDGDLTEGLHIAGKPYPLELVFGYWHAVSSFYQGERTTVDYDDPISASLFRLQIESMEGHPVKEHAKGKGKGKRQMDDGMSDDILVTFNYRDWNLEYAGIYNAHGPATNLYLTNNESPEAGDVDKEATLAFGTVLDDRGYPFLRIGLAACEADSGEDDMQTIEIIAKKTDTQEVHKLELSKNERLRLGYAVRADGHFEDIVGMGEPTDSYEALTRQLNEYTTASARIAKQLTVLRARMDDQLREAAESGQQIRSIYNEYRQSQPAPSTGIKRTIEPKEHIREPVREPPVQETRPALTFQPKHKRPSLRSPPPPARPAPKITAPAPPVAKKVVNQRQNSAAYSTPVSGQKGKKHCKICDKTVSLSHGAWTKHMDSRRHAELTAQAGVPVSSTTFGSAPAKFNTQSKAAGANRDANLRRSGLSTRASGGGASGSQFPGLEVAGTSTSENDDDYNDGDADPVEDSDVSTPSLSLSGRADNQRKSKVHDASVSASASAPPTASRPLATTTTTKISAPVPAKTTAPAAPSTSTANALHLGRRRRRSDGLKGPTQLCEACDCQISIKNWNVHTKSNKHRQNMGEMSSGPTRFTLTNRASASQPAAVNGAAKENDAEANSPFVNGVGDDSRSGGEGDALGGGDGDATRGDGEDIEVLPNGDVAMGEDEINGAADGEESAVDDSMVDADGNDRAAKRARYTETIKFRPINIADSSPDTS